MYQISNDPYLLMVLKREKEDYIEGLRKEKLAKDYARSINPKTTTNLIFLPGSEKVWHAAFLNELNPQVRSLKVAQH